MTSRQLFVSNAVNLVGTPYVFGGRDPTHGIDCWGLFPASAERAGDTKLAYTLAPWWTVEAWGKLPAVGVASMLPGDAVFHRGKQPTTEHPVEHVVMWLGYGMVLSASGGGPHITSVELALKANAKVRAWSDYLYRDGFAGFRSMREFLK